MLTQRMRKYEKISCKVDCESQVSSTGIVYRINGCRVRKNLVPEVEQLLKMKQSVSEMGEAWKISVLNEYFEKSLEEIRMEAGSTEKVDVSWEKLNTFFLDLVV